MLLFDGWGVQKKKKNLNVNARVLALMIGLVRDRLLVRSAKRNRREVVAKRSELQYNAVIGEKKIL